MSTIYDKLLYINETKGLIRDAIQEQDVEVPEGTPFREYAEKISEIKGKVHSVNGKTGDVIITLEELDGVSKNELTTILNDYVDGDEFDTKIEEIELAYLKKRDVESISNDEIMNLQNSTI